MIIVLEMVIKKEHCSWKNLVDRVKMIIFAQYKFNFLINKKFL